MYMPYGGTYLNIENGVAQGWATGAAFAEYLRDNDVEIPIVFYEIPSTLKAGVNFGDLEFDHINRCIKLENGEAIPIGYRDGHYMDLTNAVKRGLSENSGNDPIQHEECAL